MRRLTQLSIPAFIASTVGTAHLVEACLPPLHNQPTVGEDLKVAIDSWQQISQSAVLPKSRHQNDWDRPVYKAEFGAISSSLSDTEQCLSLSSNSKTQWRLAAHHADLEVRSRSVKQRASHKRLSTLRFVHIWQPYVHVWRPHRSSWPTLFRMQTKQWETCPAPCYQSTDTTRTITM